MIRKMIFEVYKDFKLIFRNLSTVLLIVLAPLFLILAVGYSFSGEYLHDIRMGIIADDSMNMEELSKSVTRFGEIKRYGFADDCIFDMAVERTHMCIEIIGSLNAGGGDIPSGEVNFYYDNTRKKISLLLLSEMKDYFGLTSERISLISTQEIIDNIQNLLFFINDRIDDVDIIKNESVKIQGDLTQRKARLVEVRDDFTPRYLYVKSVQARLHENKAALENRSDSLSDDLEGLKAATAGLSAAGAVLNETENQQLEVAIAQLEQQIDGVNSTTQGTMADVDNITGSVDSVVLELDQIDLVLNDEINRTDEYIRLINQSTERIEAISSEAKDKMEELSRIDPSLASKIVKPISQGFKMLLPGVKDIQIAFPVLLSTIIAFISMLFSNILTSLEIHNKAYVRNILAPVNDLIYTTGLAITNFIIISFQVLVLFIVAQASFGIEIAGNLQDILPITVSLIFMFIFLGMIIAYLAKNIEVSILVTTFTSLGIFLLSDVLNVVEAMPQLAARMAVFNPIVIVNSMLRQVLFFDIGLSQLQRQMGLLLVYTAVMALLLVIVSKMKNKKRL